MKCVIFIRLSNSDNRVYACCISTKSSQLKFEEVNNNDELNCDKQNSQIFTVSTWTFRYLLNELVVSVFYKQCVVRCINQLKYPVLLQIVQPAREVIDYNWNAMTTHTAWEKVELDHLLSWLSTLGGAFSALGDSKTNCAQIAGKISLHQLKLGLQFGDPLIVARSKLFVSLSLIQQGQLRRAKKIIRQQYEVAKQNEQFDPRLKKMCIGIWMKLQYAYQQRALQVTGPIGDGDR